MLACSSSGQLSFSDEPKRPTIGILGPLEKQLGVSPGNLLLQLSHSHGAPFTDPELADMPGGSFIEQYRKDIVETCLDIADAARQKMRLSVLSWGVGKCGLAYNRDLVLPDTGEVICGLNPLAAADDTLVVGRVTDVDGHISVVFVHYAAHPTSLGGGNRLVSPDYIGAMRELVERETPGATCVFLHGADGDLTPRRSFEASTDAADQNGRELGYAALSVLSSLFPPGHRMVFDRRLESGATLGLWRLDEQTPDPEVRSVRGAVALELADMPSINECRAAVRDASEGFQKERARRRLALREKVGDGDKFELPLYAWRLGRTVLLGAPVEFYSNVQMSLRDAFPDFTILVLDVCNGFLNYLPPEEDFGRDTYPVRISLFAAGSMERARDAAKQIIVSVVK